MRRRKILAVIAAGVLALTLTGCDDRDERRKQAELDQIEVGKACAEAGGQYVWDGWAGWLCEFRKTEGVSDER